MIIDIFSQNVAYLKNPSSAKYTSGLVPWQQQAITVSAGLWSYMWPHFNWIQQLCVILFVKIIILEAGVSLKFMCLTELLWHNLCLYHTYNPHKKM